MGLRAEDPTFAPADHLPSDLFTCNDDPCYLFYIAWADIILRQSHVKLAATAATILLLIGFLAACAGVRQEDLQSWVGRPVADLDKQPLFLTMSLVRTRAADGTEIRNYVNGRAVASCSGGGSLYQGFIDLGTYSNFMNCTQSFAACNNIFYIKNGVVTRYTPVGTGGTHCYTDETTRPDFSGPTNF